MAQSPENIQNFFEFKSQYSTYAVVDLSKIIAISDYKREFKVGDYLYHTQLSLQGGSTVIVHQPVERVFDLLKAYYNKNTLQISN